MVSRLWQLGLALAFTTALGCTGGGGGGTGGGGSDDFDSGFDGGGGANECLQYAEACLEDPYCACFVNCAQEYGTTEGCLERCNLAQMPYWAEQLIACFETNFGESPDPTSRGQDSQGG